MPLLPRPLAIRDSRDRGQDIRGYGENGYGIPVFTYEEVAGLLLGYDPWDLGLQLHQVAVEPLLDKIGIPYRPEDKYKGVDRKDIMKPELPGVLKCC